MPKPPPAFDRKPWPMKWIVVAIIACIVPYTWITLQYRKEGPAYEPYQDNKDRAQILRLLDAGFQRVDISLQRLVDPPLPAAGTAVTEALAGGLPPLLRDALIDKPPVPTAFPEVQAPESTLAGAPYVLTFRCTQPDRSEQPQHSALYVRGAEAVFIVGYEDLPGDLETRRLDAWLQLIVPPQTFVPGTYHATLVGASESRRWTFEVL